SPARAAGPPALVARDDRGALAVYVDAVAPLPAFEPHASAYVVGLGAGEAIERILRLVGHAGIGADLDPAKLGVRFPGEGRQTVGLPARNPRFTGREDEIRRLRAHFRAHGGDGLPWPVPVVLRGMGGVGKTAIALEYAHRFASAYDVVFWLDDDAPADPAPPLTAGGSYPRWLVVHDHAGDLERVIQRLPAGAGHLLLTSRDTPWQDLVHALSIDVLPRPASIRLLRGYLPMIEPEQAMALAAAVGDLPLALRAAGEWLSSTGAPVDEYVRQVAHAGVSGVEQAWSRSLERLREEYPPGFHLLLHLATLAPEIGLDIVYADEFAAALAGVNPATATRPYRALLVQHINRLALLRLDVGAREIHVHPLLQHLVRRELSGADLDEIRHRMHGVLAAMRPAAGPEDPASWPRLRLLWPHLAPCAAVDCADPAVRELLLDQVRHAWLSGDLATGHELASRTGAAWLGDTRDGLPGQALRLRHMLAGLIRDQGGFEPAYALDQEVLAEQQRVAAADHPDALETAGGVAADLRALGRYAEAISLAERTVASCTAAFGPDHPATLTARSSLATSLRLAGHVRSAGDADQQVYDRRRAVLGDRHPRTLASAGALGRDLRERGEYRNSVALLRTVRAATEETFGPDAVPTLLASANLAVSLRCAGLAELAAPLLEEAYEQLNERLGPNSPYTLACRHSRATNLVALEHLGSAAAELEHVQLMYEGDLGPRHPYALACANNRAVASRSAGDRTFARSLCEEADRGLREVLGPDHPHALAVRMNLAILRAEEGDMPAAGELARVVAVDAARVLGADHPDTLRGQVNLALMTGRPEEPLGRLEAVLGAKHPAVRAAGERVYLHRTLDPHLF
ncbi:FxSxx-COOH system tetratricopeptide repeat protein, partial [Asanoa sp. NPDC050611]|uniref:FxSxx-COOH system tetratricopeptide repeat protein n=1 Tax=Asanoa sp. NPDC050611 TaxID=3157098 RepID=UPI0033EFF707